MTTCPSSPEAAALEYAARGLSVVPLHTPEAGGGCSCAKGASCASAGKHPRIDWKPYQQRRATPEEIRTWWARWPVANVGVVTGMISRVLVFDVDWRSGGFESLVEMDHVGARMPDDNPLVLTGSGGLHHYFRLEAPLQKSAPFDGIDVQADGALVVAPPSMHASGRVYRWTRPLSSPWPRVPYWIRWAVVCAAAHPAAPGCDPRRRAGDPTSGRPLPRPPPPARPPPDPLPVGRAPLERGS